MDIKRGKEIIENSFLKAILEMEGLTDISYDGENIFYVTNKNGRQKYLPHVEEKEVYDLIRDLCNISDSQFSVSEPILDIAIDRYRINATHFSITRKKRNKSLSFNLRIGSNELKISEDSGFIEKKVLSLIDLFLTNQSSIIISGLAGAGKTEFQKFLISRFKENTKVIIIDNLNEIENDLLFSNLDIETWVVNSFKQNTSTEQLIRNALRCNPDWVILSEARGKEMKYVLLNAISGHPTITTLHSKSSNQAYSRMARLCLLDNENLKYLDVLEDIFMNFKLVIQVVKEVDEENNIKRHIESLSTNHNGNIYEIYRYPNTYKRLPKELILNFNLTDEEKTQFLEGWTKE